MAVAMEHISQSVIDCQTVTSDDDEPLAKCFKKLQPGKNYLHDIGEIVEQHRGKVIQLPPSGLELTIGQLEDTVYFGRDDMLESWQELYLPERMDMVVLGTIDGLPCLAQANQLVVLVGKDGSVFAYEEEELHKFAKNMKELFEFGPTFPGVVVYEYGCGYRPKTDEEYMAALKKAGLDLVSQETKDFVNRNAKEIKEMFT